MAQDNLEELADAAYQSENYDQSCRYYSQILEKSPENGRAWLRKGVSAGRLSEPGDHRLQEMYVCIDKAEEKGHRIQRDELASEVMGIARGLMGDTYDELNSALQEKKQEAMGTGQLQATRNMEVRSEGFAKAGDYIPDWVAAIKAMKYACDLSSTVERYETAIGEIDTLKKHSGNLSNFLTTHKDAGDAHDAIMQIRDELLEKAQDLDREFQPLDVDNDDSGCFVITATYGNTNHPTVERFRDFRDRVLLHYSVGQNLVDAYYAVGPSVAQFIEKSRLRRQLSRHLIVKPSLAVVSLFECLHDELHNNRRAE